MVRIRNGTICQRSQIIPQELQHHARKIISNGNPKCQKTQETLSRLPLIINRKMLIEVIRKLKNNSRDLKNSQKSGKGMNDTDCYYYFFFY